MQIDNPTTTVDAVHYRPITKDDLRHTHRVFQYAVTDLAYRVGLRETDEMPDEAELEKNWQERLSLYHHLVDNADQQWLAEREGEVIGYARSIRRGGMRQLTEFFVRPGQQSAGVGRELLRRAFPAAGVQQRCIVATPDLRAQARYLREGMYPQFVLYTLSRQPEAVTWSQHLTATPLEDNPETLSRLGEIDERVFGSRRDAEHRWLLSDRPGHLYHMNGRVIGYGYVGKLSGPFALLEPEQYPAVLLHAEAQSAHQEREEFTLHVPSSNRSALQHLLGRGFQLKPFYCFVMMDNPFGQFNQYIGVSPMMLL